MWACIVSIFFFCKSPVFCFKNVLYIVVLHRKCAREQTDANLCQVEMCFSFVLFCGFIR